jgi:probable HAF family extracellular repeat protein
MIVKCLGAIAASALISYASASRAEQQYSFSTINVPPSFNYPSSNDATSAYSINNRGQVVGFYDTCCVEELGGFLLSNDTFKQINAPTGINTFANGINDLDDIVGWSTTSGFSHGFLYNGSTFTPIDYPNALITNPFGINDAGKIVGWYGSGTSINGFVKSVDSYTTISDPLALYTFATGINNAWEVVGNYIYDPEGDHNSFIYDGSSFTTIIDPSSNPGTTNAVSINDADQVAGYYFNDDGEHGFLFDHGQYTTLDDPLATGGTFAFGINDAGDIVGYYQVGAGTYGFIATPIPDAVPEPSTWAMMLAGFAGLGFAGYRRTREQRAAV